VGLYILLPDGVSLRGGFYVWAQSL